MEFITSLPIKLIFALRPAPVVPEAAVTIASFKFAVLPSFANGANASEIAVA